jgi:hypothetical protein
VPAINAAAATEIRKRLVIRLSPPHFIARADNEARKSMFRRECGSCRFLW